MSLSLESLYQSGGFAGPPVKKEITFTAGGQEHTGTVWVRRLSYQSAVGDIEAMETDGEIAAARISNCIVDENGNRMYAEHDITGYYKDGNPVLDDKGNPRGGFIESLLHALWAAIAEVNDLGKSNSAS